MAYEKTNWTSTTPINTTNLNKIENGIEQNSNEIVNTNNKFNYSTEEQVIGTWIDGKPLYRKTFVWEKTGCTGDTLVTDSIDISSLGVDTVFIDYSSSFILDYYKKTSISPSSAGVPQQTYDHTTYIQNNKIYVRGYNSKRVITIKYTKTTD